MSYYVLILDTLVSFQDSIYLWFIMCQNSIHWSVIMCQNSIHWSVICQILIDWCVMCQNSIHLLRCHVSKLDTLVKLSCAETGYIGELSKLNTLVSYHVPKLDTFNLVNYQNLIHWSVIKTWYIGQLSCAKTRYIGELYTLHIECTCANTWYIG